MRSSPTFTDGVSRTSMTKEVAHRLQTIQVAVRLVILVPRDLQLVATVRHAPAAWFLPPL